jgi:hypothetical protein
MYSRIEDVSVIHDIYGLMRIENTGLVTWTPSGIYETSCEADISYYPMDTQTCSVILSTWAYTETEIELILSTPAIDMSYFSANGEWDLISSDTSSSASDREGQSFSRLYFTFTLQRKRMFHLLNTLFPVMLMSILTAMVFKLPSESGGKIGFSMTVLLAYAVYMMVIAENVPKTSTNVSILCKYYSRGVCYK